MFRGMKPCPVVLVPINTAIRETRMRLEDAEWDGHVLAKHYHHTLMTLKQDAERGVLEVPISF